MIKSNSRSRRIQRLLALMWIALGMNAQLAFSELIISEFLADNKDNIQDEDGESSDWLEIHNTGNMPVNLGGKSLTDKSSEPTMWIFPDIQVGAGEYLVIFCSNKDRTSPGGELHTNFALKAGGEYVGLFDADGSTVLFEYAPEYPSQTDDRSYGVDSNGDIRYFSNPTPGSENGVGDIQVAAPATPSVDRGLYFNSFTVELSSTQSGEHQIHYTLDGSEPTSSNGSLYTSPISVTTTTIMRFATFADDHVPSPISTHTYIFLEDVIEQPASLPGFPNGVDREAHGPIVALDMEMDPKVVNEYRDEILSSMTAIPTMSITAGLDDMFGDDGFYFNDDVEAKVSVELLHADPSDNDQIDGGIETHSHDRLKRSLRLNFRTKYGDREWKTKVFEDHAPLNGDSAKKKMRTLVLRSGNNRSWARDSNPDATAYTKDEFYRSSFVAINDGVGSHGTFVHLYLNGAYWGVYNLVERPDENFAASYLGGDNDDCFFTNHAGAGAPPRFWEWAFWFPPDKNDPSRWNYLKGRLASKSMSNANNYNEMQQYLNVQSFADYLLVSFYIGITDWPSNNWYVILRNDSSDLGPAPAQFQAWDGEFSLDDRSRYDTPTPRGAHIQKDFIDCPWRPSNEIVKLFCSLKKSDDFMDLFFARAALHTSPGGALSRDVAIERWNTLNAFIESAIVGESARWGDSLVGESGVTRTRDIDWQNQVNSVRDILEGNTQQFIDELKSAFGDV